MKKRHWEAALLNLVLAGAIKIGEVCGERLCNKILGKPKDQRKNEKRIAKRIRETEAELEQLREKQSEILNAHNELAKQWNAGLETSQAQSKMLVQIALQLKQLEKKLDEGEPSEPEITYESPLDE